jgi:hypothetical protein
MMFMYHCAEALSLIAIAFGVILVVWALRNEGKGVCLARAAGWVIIVLAVLGLLCSSYCVMKFWNHAYSPAPMPMDAMHGKPMNKVGGM